MRIIETTVYFFSELGEEAQNKAIEEFSDINTNFNWYEHIITEAKELGLYIGPWDLDRHRITGHFTKRSKMIAQQILVDHGPICDTCRTAKRYLRGGDVNGRLPQGATQRLPYLAEKRMGICNQQSGNR